MSISYPLTFPNRPAPSRFSIEPASFSAMTQSPWTASQQVQLNQGQMWTVSADYPPMNESDARDWLATLLAMRGQYGTVLFGNPRMKSPRGNWGSAPTVNGAGQTGQTLAVGGLPANAIIRAGDFFQLGTDASAKLHTVAQDATANGSGAVTLDIWPRLRTIPGNGDAITVSSPRGVFRLASPSFSLQFEPFRYGLSLQLIEAVA
jgi:hypothetical protein